MLILRKCIKFKLSNLQATVFVIAYIGEMRRCLKKRMMEHRLALKCCNSNNGVAAHAWVESHTVNWEGAEIRGIQPNQWKRKILEAIHIHLHTSNLVCGQKSVLLNTSSWFALCGRVSLQMYIGGHTPASSASMPMYRDMQSPPLSSFLTPDVWFNTVHNHHVGPLPPSHGYTPPGMCGHIHAVARSIPHFYSQCRSCHTSLHPREDCTLQHSFYNHR